MSALKLHRLGFARPSRRERARALCRSALTHLITIGALIAAIGVAAMAVSAGIARADTLATISDDPATSLALAMLLGFILIGMAIVTAAVLGDSARSSGAAERRVRPTLTRP